MPMRSSLHPRREQRFHIPGGILPVGAYRERTNDRDAFTARRLPPSLGNGVEPDLPTRLNDGPMRRLDYFCRRSSRIIVQMPVQRLMRRLRKKVNLKVAAAGSTEAQGRDRLRPNLGRLTVGVDLGDQWSNYCILDLEGETLAEGQLRTSASNPS